MNRDFALIGGSILFFAFGSLVPFLYLDVRREARIHDKLESDAQKIFVTLTKGQTRRTLQGENLYYSVEFQIGAKKYRIPVEVNHEFYHLQKEGKNLEAMMVMDHGQPYVFLPGGQPESRSPWLMFYIAAGIGSLGLGLLLVGIFFRRVRNSKVQ